MGVYYNLSKSSIPEVGSRWMMLIVLKVNEVLEVGNRNVVISFMFSQGSLHHQ